MYVLGKVESGLPPLKFPPFGTTVNGRTVSFIDMCWDLGSSIILVPVIAVLGNVAIAKAFGKKHKINFIIKNLYIMYNVHVIIVIKARYSGCIQGIFQTII